MDKLPKKNVSLVFQDVINN